MTQVITVTELPVVDLNLPDSSDPRTRFEASVRVMSRVLLGRWCEVTQATSPAEYADRTDPERVLLETSAAARAKLANLEKELFGARDPKRADLQDERASADDSIDTEALDAVEAETRYVIAVVRQSSNTSSSMD